MKKEQQWDVGYCDDLSGVWAVTTVGAYRITIESIDNSLDYEIWLWPADGESLDGYRLAPVFGLDHAKEIAEAVALQLTFDDCDALINSIDMETT